MKITPQEIMDWRENQTTCKVFEYFRKIRGDEMEAMIEGAYTFHEADATAQKMAGIIGRCQAYKDILDISYEDFKEVYDLTIKEKKDGGIE